MHWVRMALAMLLAASTAGFAVSGTAQEAPPIGQVLVSPVNATFPPAGTAIRKVLAAQPDSEQTWSITGWVRIDGETAQARPVAQLVDSDGMALLEIGVASGRIYAQANGVRTASAVKLRTGDWRLISLTSTAQGITLAVDDESPIASRLKLSGLPKTLVLGPRESDRGRFSGAIAYFTMWSGEASAKPMAAWTRPDEELLQFESGSPSWPHQVKQSMDPAIPQDPSTLPVSRSAEAARSAGKVPSPTAPLTASSTGRWSVGGWRLVAAPELDAPGEAISRPGFNDKGWLPATVPGTVLTSYVDNQVYPDPAHGLNNLLIPERLNRQDYWYRAEFTMPAGQDRAQRSVDFEGINYAAEVWVNGERIGTAKGAFARARFALPASIADGDRVAVAVRISPPPHPGLPHEESLSAGPGMNGGVMMVDGPTFGASQGWDWIPSVRDRNTGIWQEVMLTQTGAVRIGDPHVRTVLPRSDNSLAELTIDVPVSNQGAQAVTVTVSARFGAVDLQQSVDLAPQSQHVVRFAPDRFGQLRIESPELWWPNGYGEPILHDLALEARTGGLLSDSRAIRFGMREVSYDLSLVDQADELQRVRVAPARSSGEPLIAIEHERIRKVTGGWAVSLATDIDASPALTAAPPSSLAPHLVIRVNGVPIAVRGGNWGMDDWMKRVSRERMEPYFRLHRDANVNTIRNWMGQSTEPVFFELADAYGLLVLNDFWISTQDHNAEPGDTALFFDNAVDTVSRYRHHPSIVLWIGRNEGVPPPVLNEGLERIVRELDGTRSYLPNSREVNMAGSGPWNYRPPEDYFTKLAVGFSTEVGTPSFPTLETFKAMMPEADQWPISDSWAYHDWHQGKAGDVASFMKAMNNRLGAPTSLEDFEKKAQLLNYEAHRAIFEGMNDGLFERNSGRLLWMTHPAWPSTAWQIYSYDYDTMASFFGAKKGMEPVHVQLNLPDHVVAIANSTAEPLVQARVKIINYDLSGILLSESAAVIDARPLTTHTTDIAIPDSLLAESGVILTRLELTDAGGALLSENVYWLAKSPEAYRRLTRMQTSTVSVSARQSVSGSEILVEAVVTNTGTTPALMTKLSLLDSAGSRILPAYWSDNYLTLLPGETRTVTIRSPRSGAKPGAITINGWNVEPASIGVAE